MHKETTCLYCGQKVLVIEEGGRPKATQNGKPHKCNFSALGFSASAVEQNLATRTQANPQPIKRSGSLFFRLFG